MSISEIHEISDFCPARLEENQGVAIAIFASIPENNSL